MLQETFTKSTASAASGCVEARWKKSSFSAPGGNCVEAQWTHATACPGGDCVDTKLRTDGGVNVRDSKNPDGPVLEFTAAEWQAFIDGVKAGEFDLPEAIAVTEDGTVDAAPAAV